LDIQTADVSNAYLNAPSREQLIAKCGPEFGPLLQGRWVIIQRALYNSKSAAVSWRASIIGLLEQHGFKMCRVDNNVMMRAGFNSNNLLVGWLISPGAHHCWWFLGTVTIDKLLSTYGLGLAHLLSPECGGLFGGYSYVYC
jgi:hypothetical protein